MIIRTGIKSLHSSIVFVGPLYIGTPQFDPLNSHAGLVNLVTLAPRVGSYR